MSAPAYHEKQRLQLCAVHAINNLFQSGGMCSKELLDAICLRLDPSPYWNEHRSAFRVGNYDINVIMVFLSERDYDVIWFDKRKYVIGFYNISGFIWARRKSHNVV